MLAVRGVGVWLSRLAGNTPVTVESARTSLSSQAIFVVSASSVVAGSLLLKADGLRISSSSLALKERAARGLQRASFPAISL